MSRSSYGDDVALMAWNLHAIEQTQSRGHDVASTISTQPPTSAMSTRSVFSAAMRRGGWRSALLATNASAAASRLIIRGRRCRIEL